MSIWSLFIVMMLGASQNDDIIVFNNYINENYVNTEFTTYEICWNDPTAYRIKCDINVTTVCEQCRQYEFMCITYEFVEYDMVNIVLKDYSVCEHTIVNDNCTDPEWVMSIIRN